MKGNLPFTLSHPEGDHEATGLAKDFKEPDYPKPDGKISFDLLTNVSRSGTNHNEDQPAHLRLRDSSIPVEHNLNKLGAPEERFCPAGVYEYVDDEEKGGKRLQINFSVFCFFILIFFFIFFILLLLLFFFFLPLFLLSNE